jgi:Lrp/AsnC family transcriptional regulator, regulator for asnA, asnC and gidA
VSPVPKRNRKDSAGVELDNADRRIVKELQRNGRSTYTRLGQVAGLSEAAARHRVQRLLDSRIIQVVAVTDPAAFGFRLMATIGLHVEGDLMAVADAVSAIPEIDFVVITSGSFDILVEIVCHDDRHLLSVLNDQIRTIPGVRSSETFIHLRLHKQTYPWPPGAFDGVGDDDGTAVVRYQAP